MMRWLKDKKREKRTNSSSGPEDDDYGFEKEKPRDSTTHQEDPVQSRDSTLPRDSGPSRDSVLSKDSTLTLVSKSPPTKRELPPTPAAPEEKSPHIYEEIPDMAISSESETQGQRKNNCKAGCPQTTRKTSNRTGNSGRDKDINPYMVVPVDVEQRQTPTNFYRTGTPEVHCDVIVKDTHCEILLTRRPKVSAFSMEQSRSSNPVNTSHVDGGVVLRNNTHFCSRDRRASSDVLARVTSSASEMTSRDPRMSSAFNSGAMLHCASHGTATVVSAGGASSMSLSSLSDKNHPADTGQMNKTSGHTECEETASYESSPAGVVTYSSASNFIPRATQLTFNPLPIQTYGEDEVESMNGVEVDYSLDDAGFSRSVEEIVRYSAIQEPSSLDSQPVTYSSIKEQTEAQLLDSGSVCYASIQDPLKPNAELTSEKFLDTPSGKCFYQQGDKSLSFCDFPPEHSLTVGPRATSPSSSCCTYASIGLPDEPKLYSTITEVFSPDITDDDVTQVDVGQGQTQCATLRDYAIRSGRYHCMSDMSSPLAHSAPPPMYPGIIHYQATYSSDIPRSPPSYNSHTQYKQRFETDIGKISHWNQATDSCSCARDQLAVLDTPCVSCSRTALRSPDLESISDDFFSSSHSVSHRRLVQRRYSSPDITLCETESPEFSELMSLSGARSRDDTWMPDRNDVIDCSSVEYSDVRGSLTGHDLTRDVDSNFQGLVLPSPLSLSVRTPVPVLNSEKSHPQQIKPSGLYGLLSKFARSKANVQKSEKGLHNFSIDHTDNLEPPPYIAPREEVASKLRALPIDNQLLNNKRSAACRHLGLSLTSRDSKERDTSAVTAMSSSEKKTSRLATFQLVASKESSDPNNEEKPCDTSTDPRSSAFESTSELKEIHKISLSPKVRRVSHLTNPVKCSLDGKPKLPGNKTDSGDTCYEFDISTSSEGEQAGYDKTGYDEANCDHVLSKVSKTLNLEKETQHIDEASLARQRLLCKKCRRDETHALSEPDDFFYSDSCPHLASKFGDLKAIFGDVVVDQRAAILDCLTDFAHSPYNVKCQGHQSQESQCRECGGDVMTSDSESLTTVYSMMSQMMSPVHDVTPSAESDEGTMADNSDESGDEGKENDSNGFVLINNTHDDNSCYDEAGSSGTSLTYKTRKRERESRGREGRDRLSKKVVNSVHLPDHNTHTKGSGLNSGHGVTMRNHAKCDIDDDIGLKELVGSRGQKGKNESDGQEHRMSKSHTISEKALQDIYAPLPGKVLCFMASSGYASHNATCNCQTKTVNSNVQANCKMTNCVRKEDNNCSYQVSEVLVSNGATKDTTNRCNDQEQKLLSNQEAELSLDLPHMQEDSKSIRKTEMAKEYLTKRIASKIRLENMKNPTVSDIKSSSFANNGGNKDSDCGLISQSKDLLNKNSVGKEFQKQQSAPDMKDMLCNESTRLQQPKPKRRTASAHSGVKLPFARHHKLELADLDLLPETSLGADEATGSCHNKASLSMDSKPKAVRRTKSNIVGKMAQFFENHDTVEAVNKYQMNSLDGEYGVKFNSDALENQQNDLQVSPGVLRKLRESKSRDSTTSSSNMATPKENRVGYSQKKNSSEMRTNAICYSLDDNLSVENKNKDNEDKTSDVKTKSRGRSKPRRHKSMDKAATGGSRDKSASAGRQEKQQSPTPSSSSSSSSSKKKRHRRSGKKSYNKRRSQSRPERSKSRSSRQEGRHGKIYYYLSSDLSDIDTIEVEDYDTYAKALTPEVREHKSRHSKKSSRRSSRSDDVIASSSESACCLAVTSHSETEGQQEVYAIPPTSAELIKSRGEKAPVMEAAKTKKTKRTEIYRTRKSNNKLLSDIIIRNNDMQVFGNV